MRFGADKWTAGVIAVLIGLAAAQPASAVERVSGQYVGSTDTSLFSPSSPDPAGIVHDAAADRFIISDSEVEETPLYAGHNLWSLPRGSRTGTGIGNTVGYQRSLEPSGLGLDPLSRTLYVSDDDADKVFIDRPDASGAYGVRDGVFKVSTLYGIGDPEGVEYDPASRHLFICDGSALELNDIDAVNGTFGDGDDKVRKYGLGVHGMRDCEGLGLDTRRDLLLAVDPTRRQIFELTRAGALVRVVDLPIPTSNTMLASVALAPSSVDPARMSYWIADRHLDNGPFPDENDGLVHEVLLPGEPAPTPTPTPTATPSPSPTATPSPTPTATPAQNVALSVPIGTGYDDGNEILATGAINRSGGDLELGTDQGNPTVTALRFSGLAVPKGARIVRASVQFNADELDRYAASLTFRAHATDNSGAIASTAYGLSTRPETVASVTWNAPTWTVFGAAGADQLSPDLSAVVQEVVNRPGWASGNALTLLVRGTGRRTAESFEGGFPPVLNLEFATP